MAKALIGYMNSDLRITARLRPRTLGCARGWPSSRHWSSGSRRRTTSSSRRTPTELLDTGCARARRSCSSRRRLHAYLTAPVLVRRRARVAGRTAGSLRASAAAPARRRPDCSCSRSPPGLPPGSALAATATGRAAPRRPVRTRPLTHNRLVRRRRHAMSGAPAQRLRLLTTAAAVRDRWTRSVERARRRCPADGRRPSPVDGLGVAPHGHDGDLTCGEHGDRRRPDRRSSGEGLDADRCAGLGTNVSRRRTVDAPPARASIVARAADHRPTPGRRDGSTVRRRRSATAADRTCSVDRLARRPSTRRRRS